MNERGASEALRALAQGDCRKLVELCAWLSQDEAIATRYLATDLADAAKKAATNAGDGGLSALLNDLRNRPNSLLVAFFPTAAASEVYEVPGARIGPAADLVSAAPTEQARAVWPDKGDILTVVTNHPAQGRLGAIRTAAWLQTVLGAIGLTAYARSQTVAPLALCPALSTAMFLSTANGEPYPVDLAALNSPPASDLSELISEGYWRDLLLDATARVPTDLAQHRLTLAARWLQIATSAIGTADALVALGIALETITGDEVKGAVVERIAKRAAVFLANTAPAEERGDVYYDELRRAKKLYDVRSRVAHGQYDEWTADQPHGDFNRNEFHRFVLDVALAFRRHARERNMRDTRDFMNWWKRVELEGIFA
jgi:Apea-like HEPN